MMCEEQTLLLSGANLQREKLAKLLLKVNSLCEEQVKLQREIDAELEIEAALQSQVNVLCEMEAKLWHETDNQHKLDPNLCPQAAAWQDKLRRWLFSASWWMLLAATCILYISVILDGEVNIHKAVKSKDPSIKWLTICCVILELTSLMCSILIALTEHYIIQEMKPHVTILMNVILLSIDLCLHAVLLYFDINGHFCSKLIFRIIFIANPKCYCSF
ncbi:uncharacterized protein LOC113651654 isoform X1 [Tachysurus fulvidraco]|uniref:uncharacterized protein LOC113651654 isoform X1 n=1 Tax=Tachysurus fulvidraco TaxID=1234273 RepID=UPI001FEED423|nr:uncharacterized protein LOC113651654 isoform X1 [Tachysurus fulvidraco]XP_047670491.1 uncharacterized protein LOC113651654 isoform X1 [Tachysurus fulvidraco]XP_047670492.1 uncharacterized protein LOC113651654 isoform X1 [Tachysurus fulvidraco]